MLYAHVWVNRWEEEREGGKQFGSCFSICMGAGEMGDMREREEEEKQTAN